MRRLIAILCSCIVTSTCALAADLRADTVSHVLDELEVSAARVSKAAASSAPIRISDAHQMLRAGVTDISDALHRMPGVNLRDYGGAGGLKTVSVRGFGAGHTGVFYDGVPLSDVQSGQIDLSRYSVDNVRSVAMSIGDNDDIFLPARIAASASTVSISSVPVIGHRELRLRLRGGSFGYVNPSLRVGSPMSDNAAIGLVGDFTHADNDYPFTLVNGNLITRERRSNSRINSGLGELNFLADISRSTTLSAKAYYYNSARHLPGPVIYYNNVSNERLKEQNVIAQAIIKSSINGRLSLCGILKYNFASSMYHDENGKYPGGVLDQKYWQREYYASLAMLYTPAEKWLFDYSADYFYNNLNSNLITDGRPYRNSILQTATVKFRGKRLTAMARLLASVYLNGAHTGAAAKDAYRLSPSISVSWQPILARMLFIRASFKDIFRMPTFNEAYFDHYGSTDILPESTRQFNIGSTYTLRGSGWSPNATFTLDGYINDIRDMIVAVPYNMFIWSMVNLGKVRTYGIDATCEMSACPRDGHDVTLSLNYSFQRSMPLTDPQASDWRKQVAYIPRHSGSASVSYENPWVNVSFSGTGVSDRYTTSNNLPATRIDGYMEFGCTAWRTWAVGSHSLDIRLDVHNLFDKQYCVVARYPMPGRQYRVTLTYNL